MRPRYDNRVGTIQIGIIGNSGRMGLALTDYIGQVDDLVISAVLDEGGSLDAFIAAKPDVAVDLSVGAAVDKHGPAVVSAGIPYIIGSTGYSPATLAVLKELAEGGSQVLVVPNFSLGANLMIKFAAEASHLMVSPVITERHHSAKLDAPSGTAAYTAALLKSEQGRAEHDVPVHSVRGDGYLAEQEVQFSLPGETLTIEHRSIDRRCFMPGIVFAIRNIHKVKGLVIGLNRILDI